MDPEILYYRLRSLSLFRPLLDTPVLRAALDLLCALRAGEGEAALDLWGQYLSLLSPWDACPAYPILEALRDLETAWSLAAEAGQAIPALDAAAERDLAALSALAALDPEEVREKLVSLFFGKARAAAQDLPLWTPASLPSLEELRAWYRDHGAGQFARFRAFLWDKGELVPIPEPDAPAQTELIGYRLQRSQVEANARALLSGRKVNNVLLFGQSGTGKSATVKSLLSLPGTEDLRLIEVEKAGVASMPALMRLLRKRRQKFILFLDDLAFDRDDETYSVLKTILEGGLEPRPDNVAIYATSNRRSLVRQTISDRAGDEVDLRETIQEKTALADRFGLRIAYLDLSKAEFLELVDALAAQAGAALPPEELHAQALRWDLRHPGRSPRTARQFIASLQI